MAGGDLVDGHALVGGAVDVGVAHHAELLTGAGWTCLPSEANFFCARPPPGTTVPAWCQALRAQGIKLRDTGSFGLPGLVRLGVLPPGAQAALLAAIESVGAPV